MPESRLRKVETVITDILTADVSVRKLAVFIIPLSPSLGNISQLMTRRIYFMINNRCF